MENDLLMHNHHNNYLVVCPSELRSEILDLSFTVVLRSFWHF